MHNFNEYLCKLNVHKKEIWDSTFCRRENANDRKMTGIWSHCSLAIFEKHPWIVRLKPVRPV
jgi:hypothetical protein